MKDANLTLREFRNVIMVRRSKPPRLDIYVNDNNKARRCTMFYNYHRVMKIVKIGDVLDVKAYLIEGGFMFRRKHFMVKEVITADGKFIKSCNPNYYYTNELLASIGLVFMGFVVLFFHRRRSKK